MQKYRITHKPTGEIKEVVSSDLGKAILEQGWEIGDCECEIMAKPPEHKSSKRGEATATHRQKVRAEEAREEEEAGEGAIITETDETHKDLSVPEAEKKDKAIAEPSTGVTELTKVGTLEIVGTSFGTVVSEPTKAEATAQEHKKLIEALALEAEVMFIRMGQLLYNAREGGEWTILHYESFKSYVEDLSLPMTNSYSWATRLSNIYEYLVKERGLDEKLLAEIGVAKLTRLLPLARKGLLTDEVIEAARILSDLDLRASLGHDIDSEGGEDKEDLVICPRCGTTFNAKKANRP